MAHVIFINYRRDDATATAGRLCDRLAREFGRKNLFMDVDHIPAGVDFVAFLKRQVAMCDVFLAVISPNWLDAKDERGRRRLDDPDDFVTVEIAAALRQDIRVIPLLIDGTRIPKADQLPDLLAPLVRRNALEIRNAQFGRDTKVLVKEIRAARKDGRDRPARPLIEKLRAPFKPIALIQSSAAVLLLAGLIGLYQSGVAPWVPLTGVQPSAFGVEEPPHRQALADPAPPAQGKSAERATVDDNVPASLVTLPPSQPFGLVQGAQDLIRKYDETARAAIDKIGETNGLRSAGPEDGSRSRVTKMEPIALAPMEQVANIGGVWRDSDDPRNSSVITQHGHDFEFRRSGILPNGIGYSVSGRGTMTEPRKLRSNYDATYSSGVTSKGDCRGTVNAAGTEIVLNCNDTLLQRFDVTGRRE